jgi:hypothetical protein
VRYGFSAGDASTRRNDRLAHASWADLRRFRPGRWDGVPRQWLGVHCHENRRRVGLQSDADLGARPP